jgi:hypothetical protein
MAIAMKGHNVFFSKIHHSAAWKFHRSSISLSALGKVSRPFAGRDRGRMCRQYTCPPLGGGALPPGTNKDNSDAVSHMNRKEIRGALRCQLK